MTGDALTAMLHAAIALPLFPLGGLRLVGRLRAAPGRPRAGWLGTATVDGRLRRRLHRLRWACSTSTPGLAREVTINWFTWIPVGALQVHAALLVDPLSMTMVLFVTGVSALIHLYSIGYMKGDPDYPKFFLYLNLFVASMLILVLGNNLLFTFVGWEGVGVCSYWLVSFWFGRRQRRECGARRRSLYNRLADVGFLIAMFIVFDKTGTLNYRGIFAHLSTSTRRHVPPSACCCSSPRPASRPRSRCSHGWPTPWRAPRRCPPSSTPPRW